MSLASPQQQPSLRRQARQMLVAALMRRRSAELTPSLPLLGCRWAALPCQAQPPASWRSTPSTSRWEADMPAARKVWWFPQARQCSEHPRLACLRTCCAASKPRNLPSPTKAYARSYAHTFNGIALWKSDKCGAGLKSLDAAAEELKAAKAAAGAYDAAPPATLNLHHRWADVLALPVMEGDCWRCGCLTRSMCFALAKLHPSLLFHTHPPLFPSPTPARRVDEELERVLNDTQRRMKRENDAVFMQPVPSEAPPLPDGKRLASSVAYALPPPAAEVKDGVVDRCFAAGPAAAMQAPAVATMSAGGAAAGAGAAAAGAAAAAGGDGSAPAEQGCSCCRCGLDQCGWEGLQLCIKTRIAMHLHCRPKTSRCCRPPSAAPQVAGVPADRAHPGCPVAGRRCAVGGPSAAEALLPLLRPAHRLGGIAGALAAGPAGSRPAVRRGVAVRGAAVGWRQGAGQEVAAILCDQILVNPVCKASRKRPGGAHRRCERCHKRRPCHTWAQSNPCLSNLPTVLLHLEVQIQSEGQRDRGAKRGQRAGWLKQSLLRSRRSPQRLPRCKLQPPTRTRC